jgi:GYF domain 2
MADRQWYTGRDGKQEGPFSDERLRQLIASGMVRGETLVWSAGMTNWAKAAEVPGLMPAQRMPTTASGLPAPSGR